MDTSTTLREEAIKGYHRVSIFIFAAARAVNMGLLTKNDSTFCLTEKGLLTIQKAVKDEDYLRDELHHQAQKRKQRYQNSLFVNVGQRDTTDKQRDQANTTNNQGIEAVEEESPVDTEEVSFD